MAKLRETVKKPIIIAGNFNVASEEKDVGSYKKHVNEDEAEKEERATMPGYTPTERKSFKTLLESGYVDVWRHLHPSLDEFTFWSEKAKLRMDYCGWRFDYFLIAQ